MTRTPSEDFAAQANGTAELYREAEADRLAFRATQADRLSWGTGYTEVLDWTDAPFAKWFVGGRLNVAYNCVDRYVEAGHGDRVAIHREGEPVGDARSITHAELQDEVCRAANALTALGAMRSVVFAGFSASALRARVEAAQAKLVITTDGQHRHGQPAPLKPAVDDAVRDSDTGEHVLVLRRNGIDTAMTGGRDVWWHEVVSGASTSHVLEAFDAKQPLFLLHTSGTTGKPKGTVHTSGGYLTQASYTHHHVFDLKAERDVYWCTADIGWVAGHSYIVYGPLSNGATQVVYEGTPASPDERRHFQIIEKCGVTVY